MAKHKQGNRKWKKYIPQQGGKKEQDFTVYAGKMSLYQCQKLVKEMNESELCNHCMVYCEKTRILNVYVVKICVKKHAEFLLVSSLTDGMLRDFGRFFPQLINKSDGF